MPPPAHSAATASTAAGNRHANSALWRIVVTPMATDPRTMAYVARRTAEGKTTKQITRCRKRYVAREACKALTGPHPAAGQHPHPKSFMTT